MNRFWNKTRENPETGCIEWTAGTSPSGYGEFYYKGKTRRAHRVVYEMVFGPFSEDLIVRHTCDNKKCVNPDHLLLGTQKDNASDRVERQLMPNGEAVWSSKLTEKDVLTIRKKYANGVSSSALAAEYGLHRATVSSIVYGRTWKHLGGNIQSRTPRTKLTKDDVKEIRLSDDTHTNIARKYGVSQSQITRIKNGKRRKTA